MTPPETAARLVGICSPSVQYDAALTLAQENARLRTTLEHLHRRGCAFDQSPCCCTIVAALAARVLRVT